MSRTYRIKNWAQNYENNRTREMKNMTWLPLPVNLNGSGYVALMEKKNGPAVFGMWCALLELAATCEVRGVLTRGRGISHDISSLSSQLRIDRKLVAYGLQVLTSPEIDWVDSIESEDCEENPAPSPHPRRTPAAPELRDDCGETAVSYTTQQGREYREDNVGVDSPGPDTDPDPPRRTPPPSKPRIETRPAPAGMSRPGPLQMPQKAHSEAEKAIGKTLLAFTAGKLGEPLADPKLIEAISGELSRSGLNLDDLTEILKSKRAAVSAAKGWGLIVEIIRAACRGKPLKPRTNEFGRVLYPGDEGYAEAAN